MSFILRVGVCELVEGIGENALQNDILLCCVCELGCIVWKCPCINVGLWADVLIVGSVLVVLCSAFGGDGVGWGAAIIHMSLEDCE